MGEDKKEERKRESVYVYIGGRTSSGVKESKRGRGGF